MEATSFVSKARTAFHSAAAKAERVFTDLKFDRGEDSDTKSPRNEEELKEHDELKSQRCRPGHISRKQEWHDRFKNIRIKKKGVEDPEKVDKSIMAVAFYDENMYTLKKKNDSEAKISDVVLLLERVSAMDGDSIPPTSVMKQLATAIEAAKRSKSMKDFFGSSASSASSASSSPIREKASMTLSAVKSLVLRDKEDKQSFNVGDEEKVLSLIQSLFGADGNFLSRKIGSDPALNSLSNLSRDIHGAPPESFLVKVAEVMGSFKTVWRMALFWSKVVSELKDLWFDEQYIPGIPLDEIPDLSSCLVYQWLQVMNCCLSRKRRRIIATETLDSVMREASSNDEISDDSAARSSSDSVLYARTSTGEFVLRLGADRRMDNLTMLETGEPVYAPVTQEEPLLTEDVIKENEEFVLRTGSMGAGCSQLLSDMQAFKAANPGCILEDFIRWHSPPDWNEGEPSSENGDSLLTRGQLSTRMQKEGNLWRELWETARPVPAVKQTPLFDEDLIVEGILDTLEDIPPSELFEQLFVSLLGLGIMLAEPRLSSNDDLSKLFYECKDYVVATCQDRIWNDKVDELCQVYESVETMFLRPEEVLKAMKTEESNEEPRRRFKGLTQIFSRKDKGLRKQQVEEQKNSEDNSTSQPFANYFDGKSSLFSKKPPRPDKLSSPDENDWTIV